MPKRWTAWRLSRYENGELKEDVDASLTNGVDVNLADEMDLYIADLAKRVLPFIEDNPRDNLTQLGQQKIMDLIAELERLAEHGEEYDPRDERDQT